jgi:putative SOS response-associated peptidase YedK
MCVRIYLVDIDELEKQFNMNGISDLLQFRLSQHSKIGSNLSPNQSQVIIRNDSNNKTIYDLATWGLIPSFVKDIKQNYSMVNTRVESILEKPYFKRQSHHHRCLIPVNGYYEWSGEKGNKIPFAFYTQNSVFYLAGIWDIWSNPEGDEILSFSILTKPADSSISNIHSRMPVIMSINESKMWLDNYTDKKDIDDLIQALNIDIEWSSKIGIIIKTKEVSKELNNPNNQEFDIIKELKS